MYVVFCNTARESPGRLARGDAEGHGHSAVFAPDGSTVAAAGDEPDRLLVAELDLAQATAAEANRRHQHPRFQPFWDTGLALLKGDTLPSTQYRPPVTPERRVTLAVGQMACSRSVEENVATMVGLIRQAKQEGADLVAFPELAVTGALGDDVSRLDLPTLEAALRRLQAAVRHERITVAFGAPFILDDGRRYNSAFVAGGEGQLLTRYDQLVVDRSDLFDAGTSTRRMWFHLNGVPGVVTLSSDARWTEQGELSALRGAQIHLHLGYDLETGEAATLRRQQFWVTLASWYTFTATVNAADPSRLDQPSSPANGGSIIWDDFRPSHDHGRDVEGGRRWCALPVARAGAGQQLIAATATVPPTNLHFAAMTEVTLPSFRPWWQAGAQAIFDG